MTLKRKVLLPIGLLSAIGGLMLFIALAAIGSSAVGDTFSNVTSSLGSGGGDYLYAAPTSAAIYQEQSGQNATDGLIASQPSEPTTNNQERVILKSATLQLVVDAADTSLSSIAAMAEEMGGWVVSSTTSTVRTADGQDVAQGSITIRVPANKLDSALSQIKSGAGTVESENITGQDVTQQYVDLNSRLTNLEAAEAQLRAIMDHATKTEDVLNVYNQLVNTRGEIETIRGQLQYYQESAAYSSISVTLIPKAIETPIQIAGWSPGRTVEAALATLINVLRFGADVLITLAVLGLPLALIVIIPLWFIRRTLRRRSIANTSPA